MVKGFFGLVLGLALVLAIGGSALAAPILPGEGGQYILFGEYNSNYSDGCVIGGGYNFSDSLSVGGYWAAQREEIGVFGNLSFDPFVINCEVAKEIDSSFVYGIVDGLFVLDLDPVRLGLGVGVDFNNDGWTSYFAEVAANMAISDQFSIYGAAYYWWDGGYTEYKVGASFAL